MIKRLALAFGLLILLFAAALIAASMLIDPNDYKDEIAALAREHTGRELRIVDDMQLSLFPWLGVDLGEVTLANAPGFGPEPLARAERASVRIRLIPLLLSRRIEVDTVTVHGLALRLEIDEAGRTNWEDLGGPSAGDTEPPPPGPGDVAVGLPAALSIGGLELRRAAIYWRDRPGASEIDIQGLDLSSGRIEQDRPVDLKLDFDLRSTAPALAGRIGLSTRITARQAEQVFRADDLQLDSRLSGEAVPGGNAAIGFKGGLVADLARGTLELPAMVLTAFGLRAEGTARVEQLSNEPRVSGRLSVAEFDPRTLIAQLGGDPPRTEDALALTRAALSLQLEATAQEARVTALDVRLDDTRVQGSASVRDFGQPAIQFELAADRFDLDRYLPPGEEPPPGSAAAAPAAALDLPLDALRALDVQGRLTVGQLKATGLSLSDVSAALRAKAGEIRIEPASAALYGGRYAGALGLDARGDQPRIDVEAGLSGVQAGPLLKDMMDLDMVDGAADIRLEVSTQGATDEELRRALGGTGSFRFRDGAIKGFNAAHLVREAKARLEGGAAPVEPPRETDFTELTGTVAIRQGVLRNDDLRGSSPYLRLAGSGQADVAGETVDYRLHIRLVDTAVGQGAGLDEVKGVDIPIRITGAWADPSIGIDGDFVRGFLRDRLIQELGGRSQAAERQEELKRRAEEQAREAQEKLQDKVQDRLRGLFR